MLKSLVVITACLSPFLLEAQGNTPSPKWNLKGYIDDLQMVQFQHFNDPWMFDNEINNRLDFSWDPCKIFQLGVGMRNRFLFGQTLTTYPEYRGAITNDNGLINMTWNVFSGKSFLLVTQFDRAWISFTKSIVQVTIGRQRINWGQAFIWNPNDLFNTYSFFDFDYPERPGSDAIRLQIFPTVTSTVDAAVKWNKEKEITIAGLARFNACQYDIQFLTGLVDNQDYVLGAGWSGHISKAGFRGEISYFYPKQNFCDTSGLLLATIGVDYTFSNSFSITGQVFYNQLPPGFQPENMLTIYQPPASVKTLSFTEWNIFGQFSFPATPLFNVTLASIYYPDLDGFFLGPSCDVSIKQDLDLSIFIQYFKGTFKDTGPQHNQDLPFESALAAMRLKWSF